MGRRRTVRAPPGNGSSAAAAEPAAAGMGWSSLSAGCMRSTFHQLQGTQPLRMLLLHSKMRYQLGPCTARLQLTLDCLLAAEHT